MRFITHVVNGKCRALADYFILISVNQYTEKGYVSRPSALYVRACSMRVRGVLVSTAALTIRLHSTVSLPDPQRNLQLPDLRTESIRQLLFVLAHVVPLRQRKVKALHKHRNDGAHLRERQVLARAVLGADGEGYECCRVGVPFERRVRLAGLFLVFRTGCVVLVDPSVRVEVIRKGREVGGVSMDRVDGGDDGGAFCYEPGRNKNTSKINSNF